MTTVNKKRARISSPASDSDDEDQGNPKTHENGENGDVLGGKREKTNTCFACDGKDNWVLVCQGEECPIAIHQSCASDEPDFDESGNFYCPYCWYKCVVVKSMKLRKKLMLIEKSRKGRETLGGVDLVLMMDQVSEDMENVGEVSLFGGRRVTSVSLSGNRRKCNDESYEKFILMEKDQRMKEVADETDSGDVLDSGDDDNADEGRQQRGRFSEKNEETSDACNSNAGEERMGRERCSERSHERLQVCNSDVGEERKKQRRCDVDHETAQPDSFCVGVNTRKQRAYRDKSQKNKRLAGTCEKDVFINDEGTQARDSYLGEGISGQGCFHENNQQKKVSSAESREHEICGTDKQLLHGSGFGDRRYRQGRHIEKKQNNKALETGAQEKEVSMDGNRKGEEAVERDGDEFDLVENQDRQFQADMRNHVATINEQENSFSKDELAERNSLSSISSPMSTDSVNDSNSASQELALIIHPNACVQERPIEAQPLHCISPKEPSFQPEKYGHLSFLEKNGTVSNDPGQRKFVLCSERKRKRQFWTQAEEEMLRVGVQKFPGFRNIPWRKILEFGRDVFHDERVPSDLKDKWKNMNKMPSEMGKWVSLQNH